MCPVWTPAVDPPVLDQFCHLSHDAQRVMAAMYTDYQQRRTELIQAQKILLEPRNYYAQLYATRFGSTPGKPVSYSTDTRWSAQDCERSVSPVSVDTSRYSDSPPIETQDYRILSQFHRAESTTDSPDRDSVIADDTVSGSQCLFSQDSRATTDSGTSLQTHRQKSHGSYRQKSYLRKVGNRTHVAGNQSKQTDWTRNIIGKSSTKSKTVASEHNVTPSLEPSGAGIQNQSCTIHSENVTSGMSDCSGCDVSLAATDATSVIPGVAEEISDSVNHANKPVEINLEKRSTTSVSLKDKAMQFVSESISGMGETADNICVSNYDLSKWPASDYLNNTKSHVQDKSLLNGLSSACITEGVNERGDASNDNQIPLVKENSDVTYSKQKDSTSMTYSKKSHAIKSLPLGEDKQKTVLSKEMLTLEDESPVKGFTGSLDTSAVDMTRSLDESPYVTPGPVYDIFKRPAQAAARSLQYKDSSSMQDRNSINRDRDNTKKRVNKSKGFAVPLKKSKPDLPCDPSHSTVSAPRSSIVDISTLPGDTMDAILSGLLTASEVIMSLVYTNDSTQLRDGLFSQDPKKRQPAKLKLPSSTAVQGFAIATKSASQDVYMFPATNLDKKLHTVCRDFWHRLMVGSSRKVGFNVKDFFSEMIRVYNFDCDKVDISWTVLDPAVALWLLDPDKPIVSFDQLLSAIGMPQQAPCDSSMAALHDDMMLLSVAMGRLYQQLGSRDLWDLYVCVETKLTPLLAAMELRPFHIATHTLLQFSDVLKKKLCKLEQQAHSAAGHSFLLTSHPQLRQVLFEELRLDTRLPQKTRLAKTNVGHQTSTSEAVLSQLSPFHELPGIVLEYRQLQKLKSTYIDGILSCVQDGVLYPHWDQTAAATGRLTAYQPNIQAIPKVPVVIAGFQDNYIAGRDVTDEVELFARDSFVSQPGWSLLAADFQQIELRLLAHLADDDVLLKIFSNPDIPDIFNALTAQWLGKPVDQVTGAEREQTKRVVYSVMYGAGKEKLAEYLKISANDAKSIITSFLLKFPAVSQFTRSCVEYCQKNGYTCSIFKRRRLIPNINHPSPPLQAQAERQAVNFCVQGSAADICKAAMLQVEHSLTQRPHIKARLLVQIHDELLLEVADSHLTEVTALVKCVMENQRGLCGTMVRLRVPIPVSVSTGKTWGHMAAVQGTGDNTGDKAS